jgi:hypothetical protein
VTAAVPIVVPGAPHSQPATAFAATGDLAQTEGAPATAFAAHGDLPQTEGAPGVGAFAATTGAGAATQPAATGDLPATQPPSGGSSGYLAGDSSPPPAAIGYGATGGLPPTLPPPDASTGYLAAQAPTTGAVAPTGRWDGVDPTLVPGTVPAAGIAPAPAGDRSEWSDRSSLPPAGASGAPRATSPAGTGPGAPTGRRRLLVAAMLAVLVVAVVGVGLVILVNNGDQKGETAAGESDGAGDPASSTTQPADSPEAAVPADAPPLSADGRLRPVFGGGSPAEPASPSAPASLSSMRFAEAGDFERVAVGFGSATPPAISGTNVRADIGQLRVYFADPLPEPTADLEFLGVEKHLVHGVVFARAIFPGGTPYRWVDIYTTKPAKLEAYRVAASDSLESLVVVDIEEDPAVDLATWNTFKLDGPLREGHLGTTLRPESPDKLHVEGYAIRHDGKGELILTNNADTSITVEAETEAEPSPGYSVFFVDIDIKGLPSGDYELKWTSENREDFIDGVPPKVKVTVTLP